MPEIATHLPAQTAKQKQKKIAWECPAVMTSRKKLGSVCCSAKRLYQKKNKGTVKDLLIMLQN